MLLQKKKNAHIHQYQKVSPIYHFLLKKSRGEGWDLISNQQMDLEVQKNLSLHISSDVEEVVNHLFAKLPLYVCFI